MVAKAQDATTRLIHDLWVRNHPLMLERLALLDRAAQAADTGELPEALRAEAESTAHKLSGSLGMFGFQQGTAAARALEAELRSSAPQPKRLRELAHELRASLDLPAPAKQNP